MLVQMYASSDIKSNYYIDSKSVKLKYIVPESNSSVVLFNIRKDKHTKRVSSKRLMKILNSHGYKNNIKSPRYVNFILKSPIDTSKIKRKVKEYYENKYPDIQINSLSVEPRSYTTSLPDEYIINIRDDDYLQSDGIINIKTPENKKIFFNYNINAMVSVNISKNNIKRGVELSLKNTTKKRVPIDSFRDTPIAELNSTKFEAKHYIPENKIITQRDIQQLSLIKRDAKVVISLVSDNMNISFTAKALQNGKVNDIIKVQKSNGKILKVRVIGKNRAEMR
jgi:flagella basal body P-ring formation protein FlgA